MPQILALARAGAADAAWALLEASGAAAVGEAAALTLRGRLLKDRAALVDGAARSSLLREAGEAYAAAAEGTPATYPLINAATLSFLGGTKAHAQTLARETLALLDSGAHEPDTRYWLGATRAEALLLLGQEGEARAALAAAIAGTPRAWEDHAATLRQFRLILAEQGRPDNWLDRFQPPPAVHFAGPMGVPPADATLARSLDAALGALRPGSAIGALAAGFDITAAEALLRVGAELHLILPAGPGAFADASVRPYGADWVTRFDRLLEAAIQVETLDEPAGLCDGAAVLAEEMALGLALCEARARDAEAVVLRIARGGGDAEGLPASVKRVDVAAGAVAAGGVSLGPPARPLALVGWRGGSALPDEGAAPPVHIVRTGSLAVFSDLAKAAGAAIALFEQGAEAVVLDIGAFQPDAVEGSRVEMLLAMPARGYPLATRPAALALMTAANGGFRTAPAGEAVSFADNADFFSLWRG